MIQLKETTDHLNDLQITNQKLQEDYEKLQRNLNFQETQKSGSFSMLKVTESSNLEAEKNLLHLIEKHTLLQIEMGDIKVSSLFIKFYTTRMIY